MKDMKTIDAIPELSSRSKDAHKGTAGLVLVVAGSRGMAGAAALVGNGALRGGAGLVKIATPDACLDTVAALAPCCTTAPLPDNGTSLKPDAAGKVSELAEDYDVLAMGPGLSQAKGVASAVRAILFRTRIPVVLDADGLNVLADAPAKALGAADPPVIITPHPGEAARLLGSSPKDVQANRRGAGQALARLATVAVLKGAGTVVTDGERMYVNDTGNPNMATAGAGDVLTGLMAALLAAGMEPFDAAVLAVHAHGRAGDLASKRWGRGLTALDILGCVPEALGV